jgi:hypothetical protein
METAGGINVKIHSVGPSAEIPNGGQTPIATQNGRAKFLPRNAAIVLAPKMGLPV